MTNGVKLKIKKSANGKFLLNGIEMKNGNNNIVN